MMRYHVLVRGCVQGVGFRYFCKYTADRYSLTGWVRNLDDGSVEIEVQGLRHGIQAFLRAVRQGSRFSAVESADVREIPQEDENGFEITG